MDPEAHQHIRNAVQDLVAQLARATLNAKTIQDYLKIHANCTYHVLKAEGFAYYLKQPDSTFAPVFTHELNKLKIAKDAINEQVGKIIETKEAYFLKASSHDIHWNPIISDNTLIGILQFWFSPSIDYIAPLRQDILAVACSEMGFYLKLQNSNSLPEEHKRLTTYTHLLEELAGDLSIETIGWKLVNYARETAGCSRVCLFTAEHYGSPGNPEVPAFRIQSCSGLKKVHPRSEHAVILENLAKELAALSLHEKTKQKTPLSPPVIAQRKTPRNTTRPETLVHYFALIPMDWTAALPLYDKNDVLCGILLFEGQGAPKDLQVALMRMQAVARSGGIALARALLWAQHYTLRATKMLGNWLQKTSLKRKHEIFKKTALGVLIICGILLFPLPQKIKGQASVYPARQETFASLRTAKIEQVYVKPGQYVKKGAPIIELSTKNLLLLLQQAKQSFYRAHTEADQAQHEGNEASMHQALIRANANAIEVERLLFDIESSKINAPFDGIILGTKDTPLKRGEIVLPGEPILKIADTTTWQVQMELREQDLITLQAKLRKDAPMPGTLKLLAIPNEQFPLSLNSEDQLSYGETPISNEYTYSAHFKLETSQKEGAELKNGYIGKASINIGWQTIGGLLFHDFITFIKVRSF
ncbi:MAG: hypothetical protein Tsb0018_00710 [Opitutales bacterium]